MIFRPVSEEEEKEDVEEQENDDSYTKMFQEPHLELITMDCLNLNIYSPSDYQHHFQQFQMKPLPQVKHSDTAESWTGVGHFQPD